MAYLPQLVGEGRAQEAGGPQFQANTYDDICDCSCISLEHLNLKITTFYNIYIYIQLEIDCLLLTKSVRYGHPIDLE